MGGCCAVGVAGQLSSFNTRSDDHHSSISGAAWDITTDYSVGQPTDPHIDSAGGSDHI